MTDGLATIEHTLARAGLAHRLAAFHAQGIDPGHLRTLTNEDLRELGLTIGERKRFIQALSESLTQALAHPAAHASPPQPLAHATPGPIPERRPLTIVFIDLAGSVELGERLEAEDFIEVIRAYREFSDDAIEHYGGRVAQYHGDGILAYFCYPIAHENDAVRAVRAALDIADGVPRLVTRAGTPLQVRIGIATGRVVISNLFSGTTLDAQSFSGSISNLAARLQALAPPNGVILSELTQGRVGALVHSEDLGLCELRGFATPQHVFHALRARPDAAAAVPAAARLTPMFARDHELGLLTLHWHGATSGSGTTSLVTGEAGIGKSRLVERFTGVIATDGGRLVRITCSPFDQDSLFRPFLAHFRIAAAFHDGEDAPTRHAKLAATLRGPHQDRHLPVLADLLQVGPTPGPAELPPSALRERALDALQGQFLALLEDGPLCIVVEDVHWIDPTSRALIERLAAQTPALPLLLVLTTRESADRWISDDGAHLNAIELPRLGDAEVAAMVQAMFGDEPVPHSVARHIVGKTDGLPLFVEEYVRPLLVTSGAVDWSRVEAAGDTVRVPDSLHDALMARLDRSGPAKEVAQVAAVIGRIARRDVLAAVAGLEEPGLDRALAALREAGVLHAHSNDGRDCFIFGHALVRDTAYDSLLRDRRRDLHGKVARALVQLDPDGVELQPELLALHLTEAGLPQEAVPFWHLAGQRAVRRSALLEAVRLLRRGLAAIDQLDAAADPAPGFASEWRPQFMALLGPALMALRGPGSPDVRDLYAEAYAEVAGREEAASHFPIAWGWWRTSRDYLVRGERAATLLSRAHRRQAPELLLQAHHCNWAARFVLGELDGAVAHALQGLTIYHQADYSHHASLYGNHDACVCAHGELAQVYWMQGRVAEAFAHEASATGHALNLQHLGSRIHAMDMALLHRSFRGDHAAVAGLADELVAFADEHGLPDHRAKAILFRGWAAGMTGADRAAGLAELRAGLARQREIGTLEDFPIYAALLADVLVHIGDPAEAITMLTDARQEFDKLGLRIWLPEVLRGLGVARLAAGEDPALAEAAFIEAGAVATSQNAPMLGLRAALDLARLHRSAGEGARARAGLQAALAAVPDGRFSREHRAAVRLLRTLPARA